MVHLPTILVAGYGAWAKAKNNPAALVVEELKKRVWDNCRVLTRVIPVDSARLSENISDLIEIHQPDAWIGLGVSERAIIQAEMVGINWRHFDVPDAAGRHIQETPIVAKGPVAYNATLPNADMVAAINRAGIPADLSFSAGTHLCNQMLYTVAREVEARGLTLPNGFIHIPHFPSDEDPSGLDLLTSTNAIAISIETLAAQLVARHAATA